MHPSSPSDFLLIHTLVINSTYDTLFLSNPILKLMAITQIMLT